MYKKLMIIYLGILAAMAPLATDMYLPSLPELQADFGSSTALIQLTLTMTTLGMAAGQIFAGPISDLRGRKVPEYKMLFASIAMQILGSILLLGTFAFADNFWLVLLFLAISVMPIPIIGAVSFSLALNGQGRNAGSASALLGFFSMFLGALMMPVAGYIGTDTGIPMAVIMLCGFLLAMLCYWTMIQPEHQR
ncbi:MAG: MFS transporter [Veillonellaceae bacterium]|nr:MFS transporter [Veillonellaceae bacterium]MDD6561867.1 MFS transporter [Veillonellaceae bacterium]MDD7655214.1 MFS transporter [Veillonellaceae bacterium]MEE0457412.1 MFS transporter [Anaerovibrio sp.]